MVGVAEEAAVEVYAGVRGGEAVRELEAALEVANLAACGGEVAEALSEAVHRVRAARDRGAEAALGDVLEDHLHRGHEVHVECLRVLGLVAAAYGVEYGRRRVPRRRGDEEDEDEEEDEEVKVRGGGRMGGFHWNRVWGKRLMRWVGSDKKMEALEAHFGEAVERGERKKKKRREKAGWVGNRA